MAGRKQMAAAKWRLRSELLHWPLLGHSIHCKMMIASVFLSQAVHFGHGDAVTTSYRGSSHYDATDMQ